MLKMKKISLLHENTFAHALLNKAKIMQPKICFMITSLKNITHVSFKRQKMDRYYVFNISEHTYDAFSLLSIKPACFKQTVLATVVSRQ